MPSGSGNKKTIQINHEFFKIGKKGLNAVTNKQTQKQERKKHNKTVKHNTIKKELVKRIQQLKQQEKQEASRGGSDNIVDNIASAQGAELEAMEAGIYAIEHPDSDQKFAVSALHSALNLIDPHHEYKK